MSPAEKESALCGKFSIIADPHERLAAIVTACTGSGISAESRDEEHLVPGCVSRVWLTVESEHGLLRLHWQADSPLVQGLVGLVCRVYEGSEPAAAAAFESTVLDRLGLTRQISPTRLHGLASVVRRIRELARAAGPGLER